MDIVETIAQLIRVALALSILSALVLLVFALIKRFNGEDSEKLFYSSILALILATNFSAFLYCFLPSKFSGLGSLSAVVYVAIALFFLAAIVYFAMGRFEKGISTLKAVIALIVVFLLFPTVAHVSMPIAVGSIPVTVNAPGVVSPGTPAKITVKVDDHYSKGWTYTINFGDNTTKTVTSTSNQVTFTHEYALKNGSVTSYPITVNVVRVGQPMWEGIGYAQVTVKKLTPWNSLLATVMPIGKIADKLLSALQLPLGLLYTVPLITPTSPAYEIYRFVLGFSMSIFLLMLFAGIVTKLITEEDPELAVVDALKDGVVALLAAFTAPFVYNVFATLLNYVSTHVIQHVQLASIYAGIAATVVIGLLVGSLQTYISSLAAMATTSVVVASALATLRYLLLLALAALSPLMAVLSVSGIFKSITRYYLSTLATLMMAGPLVSTLLALLAMIVPHTGVGKIMYLAVGPLIITVLPFVLSTAMTASPMAGSHGMANLMMEGLVGGGAALGRIGGFVHGAVSGGSAPGSSSGVGEGGGLSSGGDGGPLPAELVELASRPNVQVYDIRRHLSGNATNDGQLSPVLPTTPTTRSEGTSPGTPPSQGENAPLEESPEENVLPENQTPETPEHGDNLPGTRRTDADSTETGETGGARGPVESVTSATRPDANDDNTNERQTGLRTRVLSATREVASRVTHNARTFSKLLHERVLYYHHVYTNSTHPRKMRGRVYEDPRELWRRLRDELSSSGGENDAVRRGLREGAERGVNSEDVGGRRNGRGRR